MYTHTHIGSDSQGHPTLKTTGCSLSIGSLHVTFHGGASWLYNLFDDTIASSLKSSLQSQVYMSGIIVVYWDYDNPTRLQLSIGIIVIYFGVSVTPL